MIGAGSMAVGRLVATAGMRSGMVYPPLDVRVLPDLGEHRLAIRLTQRELAG